jgi:hypothetical protein
MSQKQCLEAYFGPSRCFGAACEPIRRVTHSARLSFHGDGQQGYAPATLRRSPHGRRNHSHQPWPSCAIVAPRQDWRLFLSSLLWSSLNGTFPGYLLSFSAHLSPIELETSLMRIAVLFGKALIMPLGKGWIQKAPMPFDRLPHASPVTPSGLVPVRARNSSTLVSVTWPPDAGLGSCRTI